MIDTAAVTKPSYGLIHHVRGVIKGSTFLVLILFLLAHHSVMWFIIRNEEKRLRYYLRSIQITSRIALKILNVKITRLGERGEVSQRLIVANHLSYLDVIILFTEFPSLFITSTEMRDTPGLGHVCKLAGCFFVERRREKRSVTTKEAELLDMKQKFTRGFNVFLFPEGTTSDGKQMLPFKGTFFQLAYDTGTHVVPICLKYTGDNRDVVPWYGDMTFGDHFYKLCLLDKVEVTVNVLPDMEPEEKMKMAKSCFEKISEAYA